MDWLIRASDMTISERNTIYDAIMRVETEREKKGDYRKMFAYSPCKDWVMTFRHVGLRKRKCAITRQKARIKHEY